MPGKHSGRAAFCVLERTAATIALRTTQTEGGHMGLRDFIYNMSVPEVRRSLWEEFSKMNAELFENLADIARGREPRHLAKAPAGGPHDGDADDEEEEPTEEDSESEEGEEEGQDNGGEA
jgi:hypothetical protein